MHRETVHALSTNDVFGPYNTVADIDPEHIPNWMRAFYDDFVPESHGMVDHSVIDESHPSQAYISAGLHAPVHSEQDMYDDFVRIHQGSAMIEPAEQEFSYGDASVTPAANNRKRDVKVLREDPFTMDFDG